jgi:hypothetical protein
MGSMLIPLEWSDFIFPGKRVSIEEEWFGHFMLRAFSLYSNKSEVS